MSLHRLRTDFRFAALTLLGSVAVAGIAPFAVYRALEHQPGLALLDAVLVLAAATAVTRLWRGGDAGRIALALMAMLDVAFVAVTALPGLNVLDWAYPVLLANYLVLSRNHAIVLTGLLLLAIGAHGRAFGSGLEAGMFFATTLATALFALMFADRMRRQHERLEALATLDALTGALNRRVMAHELQRAIDRARREHAPLGLAVLDLDHFKRINDAHGHEAGDRVLVEFAQLVGTHSRRGDGFFRLGGEEFLLLLPNIGAEALRARCEGLREAVAGGLDVRGEAVTVSIGAALLAPDEAMGDWLARADAAMYRAKREGRNRVVLDTPS